MRVQEQRGEATRRGTIDSADVARFERLGTEWWDPKGPMGKLHEINPVRMRYLGDLIARLKRPATDEPDSLNGPFHGLTMLDIGGGGGILSEPLARLGGTVTGIDPGPDTIAAARQHADGIGLTIDYRATTAEALAAEGA